MTRRKTSMNPLRALAVGLVVLGAGCAGGDSGPELHALQTERDESRQVRLAWLQQSPVSVDDAVGRLANSRRQVDVIAPIQSQDTSPLTGWPPPAGVTGEATMPVECDSAADPMACWGAILRNTKGCVACHSVDGSAMTGPTWKGLFGKMRSFTAGEAAPADDAYLRHSIMAPSDQVVQGFQPAMPVVPLHEKEVDALIEYIKSMPAQ